jgi:NAD(P)H-hydrate epimerase
MLPHDMGVIIDKAVSIVFENLSGYDAILIGPGLGQEDTTGSFLDELLNTNKIERMNQSKRIIGFVKEATDDTSEPEAERKLPPVVIDADGLNLLAKRENWWEVLAESTILTPHPGEMARLSGKEIKDVNAARVELAAEMAKKWRVVLVLKGAHTVVAAPDGQVVVMPFKTDALATAGTGDVLAGVITGLRAQGLTAFDAAVAGTYVHGLAGEITAQRMSSRAVIATDVLDSLSAAFHQIDML